jgi:hypothetical protein
VNEQEFRETLKDFGQLVRPVPGMADLALAQARRRGHVKRAAVVGGTAFAVAGVFGAAAALPVLDRGFAPADGGGPEPTVTEAPSTPMPSPADPVACPTWSEPTSTPTPMPCPPEPEPTHLTPYPEPEPTVTTGVPEPTPSFSTPRAPSPTWAPPDRTPLPSHPEPQTPTPTSAPR